MKKLNYLLKTFLLLTLIVSCSEDDAPVIDGPNRNISNIVLNKQNSFVGEDIALTFDASNYESITVTSDDSNISITLISETSYTITSTKALAGYVDIATTIGEETEIDQVYVTFTEHGTTDYQTIEGITIGESNINNLKLLLGEAEAKTDYSVSNTNEETGDVTITTYEIWHYLSRGLSFLIREGIQDVVSVRILGTSWGIEVDGEIKPGVPYPYEIGNLGNFSNADGILMDDVIAEFGALADENKSISEESVNVRYNYPLITETINGDFYFTSDDIDDYQGKALKYMVLD